MLAILHLLGTHVTDCLHTGLETVNINVVQCQVIWLQRENISVLAAVRPTIEAESLLLCTSIETNLWMSEHRL